MKITSAVYVVVVVLGLTACGSDNPRPADGQANDLREAVQKPIGATNQAVDQSQATQDRLNDAMQQIESGNENAANKDEKK